VRYLALFAICLAATSAADAQKKPTRSKPSKGEVTALNTMLQAQTPDDQIKAADDFVTKFSDSQYKDLALFTEADAYEAKNNHDKAIVYAEQTLDINPKNYDALNLIANVTANQTKDTDLDMAEKLSRAEKAAKDAIEAIKTSEKPAGFTLTDAQWDTRKKVAEAQSWQALGTVAIVRKKTDEALDNFNKGLALNPDPLIMLRAGRALLLAKKYDDAIGMFDKAAASPDASPQVKNIANSDKARATAAKAQAK
jgi:tetratricopeptide (TPR) repeat protein